mmetsp:Transcript_3216/g.13943  ORF Transcript_3216/g.13943 Transcript_3216/m.13943 type:complete len:355 (+) Transcript_3216:790-1854(+)
MAATPEVGKSRYLAASHAVAAVVPSSSLGLAPLPPLDATVASSTSADRTRSAAWCVPAASGFLFRLAWYLLTAHSRAIRRSTASAAALRPLHRQKGTRRSEAAASRATVHHPDASSSVGRRLRMASTAQTTISSRNCTASAAAAALAASARSLSRAPPSSAGFLLEPPKYPVFSFFSFAAVSSAAFTAAAAAAAARLALHLGLDLLELLLGELEVRAHLPGPRLPELRAGLRLPHLVGRGRDLLHRLSGGATNLLELALLHLPDLLRLRLLDAIELEPLVHRVLHRLLRGGLDALRGDVVIGVIAECGGRLDVVGRSRAHRPQEARGAGPRAGDRSGSAMGPRLNARERERGTG